MNASDILFYGHRTALGGLAAIDWPDWETSGVCGYWSVRQIIAHLASYERLLEEVFENILSQASMPGIEKLTRLGAEFNDVEVAVRAGLSPQDTLDEYEQSWQRNMALAKRISMEVYQSPGRLPWYGLEYALDDYLVYQFYGHKREHTAQIAVFKDRLREAGRLTAGA